MTLTGTPHRTLYGLPKFGVPSWRGPDHPPPIVSMPPGIGAPLPDNYLQVAIEVTLDEAPGFPSEFVAKTLVAIAQKTKMFISRFA